jgi:hypothetical protein
MLALSDDGQCYRVRERTVEAGYENGALRSLWQPLPGVEVESWLVPKPPWHLRIHRLRTDRPLWSAEGGFALDRSGDDPVAKAGMEHAEVGLAYAVYPAGNSGIRDLWAGRNGRVLRVDPNSNLMAPRTVLPVLLDFHEPGAYWLACAVLAETDGDIWNSAWENLPKIPDWLNSIIENSNDL